jgi:hypothetical protein
MGDGFGEPPKLRTKQSTVRIYTKLLGLACITYIEPCAYVLYQMNRKTDRETDIPAPA